MAVEATPWRSSCEALGAALGASSTGVWGWTGRWGGLEIRQQLRQPGPRDAVDQGVVRLHEHGEAIVLEALDAPQLPQRPAPVEGHCRQVADHFGQLTGPAGRRDGDAAEMVCKREGRVGDEHRPVEAERHVLEFHRETRARAAAARRAPS